MSRLIGYYVHHQGDGHRQRALSIAAPAPDRFALIGTGLTNAPGPPRSLMLADDRPAPGTSINPVSPLDCLHYAPEHHPGIQARVARVAEWIAREQPALLVVDVSVEIAILARLASVPTVYVRLSGIRGDAAHLQAFRGARALLAPFHRELDDPAVPAWVREKTAYFPGLTQVAGRSEPDANVILWVNGRGGAALDGHTLAAAAASAPHLSWRIMGPAAPPVQCPPNLTFLGWVEDPQEHIANAGVVIGSAGDGVVNAVIAAGRPYVCLPQPRPYDEQLSKARRMGALGAAIVLEATPAPAQWPELLHQARHLNPAALARLGDVQGRHKACEFLCGLANR